MSAYTPPDKIEIYAASRGDDDDRNGIGYCEGSAIGYLARWRAKGGIEDLKKARHFIDLLIEMEVKKPCP